MCIRDSLRPAPQQEQHGDADFSRGIKDVCQKKRQRPADIDAVCRYVPGRKNSAAVFGGAFMIKTARQLKDLIRNLSRKKSADAQLLMRNYMMERFLERISLSEYRDKFILKGGMLVAAMVGLDARSTMDLDATVKGANVNVEDIENLISAIVSVPLDDGVKFQLKSISEIMDEAEYPGIRVNMTTTFDGVVTPLKIDISTGDAITPRAVSYTHLDVYKRQTLRPTTARSSAPALPPAIMTPSSWDTASLRKSPSAESVRNGSFRSRSTRSPRALPR